MNEPQYHSLPDELSVLVSQHWQHFVESGHRIPDGLLADLPRVWAGSDYAAAQFQRDPGLGEWLLASDLSRALAAPSLKEEIRTLLAQCDSEDDLKRALRRLRHRHMVRISGETWLALAIITAPWRTYRCWPIPLLMRR